MARHCARRERAWWLDPVLGLVVAAYVAIAAAAVIGISR